MRRLISGLLSLLMLSACGGSTESPIPPAPVYYEVALQLPQYRPLQSPGGVVLVPRSEFEAMRVGARGLALVHALEREEYYAFDLACPVEPYPWVRLELSGLELRCPKCESHFDILSGTGRPTSGVARSPLRRYRAVRLEGQAKLLVTN